jgi:hypothetical protein
MGSVTALWQKPRTYARFLGEELSFVYKQRLLIVMPNGFGFNWPKHSPASEYALLARVPIPPVAAGLIAAAQTAVQRLAAAAGVKVTASAEATGTSPAQRNAHDRLVILAAALAAMLLAAAVRLVLRRRRR